MKISVTAHHILHGVRGSCSGCPVALALAEAFPDSTVNVGSRFIKISSASGSRSYWTPPEVAAFIVLFDAGLRKAQTASTDWYEYAAPFEFELPEPETPA